MLPSYQSQITFCSVKGRTETTLILKLAGSYLKKHSFKNLQKYYYYYCQDLFTHKESKRIENILEWNLENPSVFGMNFVSPFQPEREFKLYKSCKCSQIICSTLILYVP